IGKCQAKDLGITARFYDTMIGSGIADLIHPNTRIVWLDAPGSVTMEVPEERAITAVARARGIVTSIDNTYTAGLPFKPFEHG
ncbi:PLP-dependent transferase, partial [Burkholderia pseudomallei]